jgi:UDP-N-acetylmuramoyl-tripeptide--D-alanyl-D-alanine ligase
VIRLTLAEVAAACEGRLEGGDPQATVTRVATDTRALQRGDLYVALRGERFDGDSFAGQALAAGVACAVVRAETASGLPAATARIVVDDGQAALGRLAAAVRRRARARVVGITGSAGKTSTKDILASLLRPVAKVVATHANLNNEIGVPLTLLQVDEDTDVVVVEMAMRGLGQIRELARIARPDIGVITNIAPVHLELVGTLEDVASAKAELIEELEGGVAVVPADEPLLDRHLHRYGGRVVTFGGESADVALMDQTPRGELTHALVDAFGHRATLDFNFSGAHYLRDALAAMAAFTVLGYRLDEARDGAALPGDGLLLNDAYNANPLAMTAAVDHLVAIAGGRPTLAIIGDMYELGPGAEAFHRGVGEHCATQGVRVAAVGELAGAYLTGAPGERWFATVEDCLAALPELVEPGGAVLVKASRRLRLERVAVALEALLREQDDA